MVSVAGLRNGATVVLAIGFALAVAGGPRLIVPLLAALVEAIAIVAAGAIALRMLVPFLGPQRTWPVSKLFVAGYPVFGTLCFAIGIRSTSPSPLWTVTGLLALFGVGVVIGRPRFDRERDPVAPHAIVVDWLLAGATLVTAVLFAQLPPFTLDELAYHLAAPMSWVVEGRVTPLSLNSHSFFPFGIEGADLPLLALGHGSGAIASHFLHLLSAIAAFQLLRRELSPRLPSIYAVILAFVTTPALLVTAGWSWNEWPLVALCILLTSELRRLTETTDSKAMVALTIAGGLLTKYSFVPFAGILVVAAVAAHRESFTKIAATATAGTVVGSFFFVRNFLLTGNPLYPFFSPLSPSVSGYRREATLLSSLQSYAFDRRFVDESLVIGMFLCGALALAFLTRVESKFIRLAAAMSTIAGFVLLLTAAPSSRIVVPFFVPALFAASDALPALSALSGRLLAVVLRTAALVQLAIAGLYLASFSPVDVLARRTSSEEFLRVNRRLYPQIVWLDSQLPSGSRTLVVGAQELYWFSHAVRGGGNFDGPRVATYVRSADAARLKRDGFTHVAVITTGLRVGAPSSDVKRRERETVLDPAADAALRRLMTRDSALVARRGPAMLFRLQ